MSWRLTNTNCRAVWSGRGRCTWTFVSPGANEPNHSYPINAGNPWLTIWITQSGPSFMRRQNEYRRVILPTSARIPFKMSSSTATVLAVENGKIFQIGFFVLHKFHLELISFTRWNWLLRVEMLNIGWLLVVIFILSGRAVNTICHAGSDLLRHARFCDMWANLDHSVFLSCFSFVS